VRAFLRSFSWGWLILIAILAGIAPWPVGPEPHLVEKLRWLAAGSLSRLIDIFDLLFHASPLILLCAKLLVTRGDEA
jgi:hypothetical protein